MEPAGGASTDVVAVPVSPEESWPLFVTEPVVIASTEMRIVIVFVFGANLRMHVTVPL